MRRFLEEKGKLGFSYADVGATGGDPPPGYRVNHARVQLGRGTRAFGRAVAAVRRWEMFRIRWIELLRPNAPIEAGATVGVLARLPGLWSLNACRVVYLVEEDARYGFAYGTLPGHEAMGEERFLVERRSDDDSVWYELFSFSKPSTPLGRAAFPVLVLFQRRFARDSVQAMREAVCGD